MAILVSEHSASDWREISQVPLRGRTEAIAYFTPTEPNAPADLGMPVPRLAEVGP